MSTSWIVRSYYRIWLRLGSVAGGLAGSGAYAISCEGRARFGRFPDIVADDLFVEQRFGREERVVVDAAAVAYAAPVDVRELFARKVRVFAGNLQLEQALAVAPAPDSAPGGDRWWRVVLRAPRMVKDVPVYVAITAVAKRKSGEASSKRLAICERSMRNVFSVAVSPRGALARTWTVASAPAFFASWSSYSAVTVWPEPISPASTLSLRKSLSAIARFS